jgi:hypothetical protein
MHQNIKIILILFLCIVTMKLQSQTTLTGDQKKKQLDSIMKADQMYRPVFHALLDPAKKDSLVAFHKMTAEQIELVYDSLQEALDSTNLLFIERFIGLYGYPGKSMVGEPSNEVAWYVIQHSDKIARYFSIIKEAGKRKEIPYRLVAMMQDRLLVEQQKKQLYGTQVARRRLGDSKEETMFVWPVKHPCFVNRRRKKAGFETTIQQNAKRFHIEYKKVRLKDIRPLT